MNAPNPAAPVPNRERTRSTTLMKIASVLYGLSLLLWLMVVPLATMGYEDPGQRTMMNTVMIALLGWPAAVAVGLLLGWKRRRYLPAIVGILIPLVYALAMAGVVHLVDPSTANAPALTAADGELAGIHVDADVDTALRTLGAPTGGSQVSSLSPLSPEEAVTAAHQNGEVSWQYPAKGITLQLSHGRVREIDAAAPWTGRTPRGLLIGQSAYKATRLYGVKYSASLNHDPEGFDLTYFANDFSLTVEANPHNQVTTIRVVTALKKW